MLDARPDRTRIVSEPGNTNWDQLSEFAQRREELDPFLLRGLLANALRKRGYASIVSSKDGAGPEAPKKWLPGILAAAMLWSFGVSLGIVVGLPWYLWPLGIVAVMAVIVPANSLSGESAAMGSLLLVSWVVLGVVEAIQGAFAALAITYLLPLGLGAAYGMTTRVLRLRDAQDVALALGGVIKSAPLVAPVVLIVLFLPALSADVWRVAGELSAGSLLIVGALSVGLLFVVVRLQLGSQVEQMVSQRAEHLSDVSERAEMTRKQILAASGDDSEALMEGMSDSRVDGSWPVAGEEYAPYLRAAAGETLQAPLTGRLALTIGVVGILFSAYVYLLCSAVVPAGIAGEWSAVAVPSTNVDAFGASIHFHGGPYLSLAALLGLAATATFLSFALVEERFAKALTDALLRDPTDRFLILALPYMSLWEAAIEKGRAARQPAEP